MNVYLTGVNLKKSPKKKTDNKNTKLIKSTNQKIIKENSNKIKEETNAVNEGEISSEQVKVSFTSKEPTNKTNQILSSNNNANNNNETNKINSNNFISKEDKNKKPNKYLTEREFSKIRQIDYMKKKKNEKISNELRNDYVDYIMLKEPKYADFDKISEEFRQQLYLSYQKYNNNRLIILRKKEEIKFIVSTIEKSLVNNYFLKDSSMLPVYEKLIEKVKLDILTKKQEHDSYKSLYDELYNKNFTLKRKVLDEIDIDTINNTFYDQYKILKNHAIVQVSKKQEVLDQIGEYHQKMTADYEKEMKQKNKTLRDLRLHIEVFKEDEKDLINKLAKIKKKREEITELIKVKMERNETINHSLGYIYVRLHKSFISMNKIFRSVNANNLDDVLLDVSYINHKFIQLKNRIVAINQNISDLNSEYTKLCLKLEKIKKDIILEEKKNKTTYNREDAIRVIQIREELKQLNEDKIKINEIIQNNKGTFQQGITFLFQKIKIVIKRIKPLRKVISPKLMLLIKKYKNVPFSVDYNNINKDFLKNFAFLFFKFSHIIFYLFLNSMSSGININNLSENYELKSLYNRDTLKKYEAGIKKSLETYSRRIKLKHEKQKELNSQTRKKELERQLRKSKEDNNITTQNKIFKRFLYYLHNKNLPPEKEKPKHNRDYLLSRESSKNSTSFFFTGIDFSKPSKQANKDSSKNNSINDSKSKYHSNYNKDTDYKDKTISYREKKDFLMKNQNKFKNIFYRYQNVSIRENEKNLLYQKKFQKHFPRSESQPKIERKINFPLTNKLKKEKEESTEKVLTKPKLMDDDYTYDEDENDQKKTRSVPLKKNKTFNNLIFFKLNKDRANIYKKMNDLRKLQMAYFGGRFLNTHNTKNGQNMLQGNGNIFDDFVSNYFKKQNQDNEFEKTKRRKSNFRKKLVEKISANRKLRDKTSFLANNINNRNHTLKNEIKRNKTYDRFKNKNNMKINYSSLNKKSMYINIRNERPFNKNKYKKMEHKKLYSKSVNDEVDIKNNYKKIKDKNRSKSTKNYVGKGKK